MESINYSQLTIDEANQFYACGDNENGDTVYGYLRDQVLNRTSAVDVEGVDDLTYFVVRPSIGVGYTKTTVVFEGDETIEQAIDQMVKAYNEFEAVLNGEMTQEWCGSYSLDNSGRL